MKFLDFDIDVVVPGYPLTIGSHSDSGMLPAFFNQVEINLEPYKVGIFIIFLNSEGSKLKFHRDDCFSLECEVERSLARWEPLSSLMDPQHMMKLIYPRPLSSGYFGLQAL